MNGWMKKICIDRLIKYETVDEFVMNGECVSVGCMSLWM